MSTNSSLAKSLRFLGILLMGFTAGFTLLGGIGTSCVAINPTSFGESMARLAAYQWLYIIFVLAGIVLGVFGIHATIMLVKGRDKAYMESMVVLIVGTVIGVIHILGSRALRGKSMPVDAVVYTTVVTLIIFLLFRIPSVWRIVNFAEPQAAANRPAGGAAAISVALLAFTIQYTMGPTHTWDHINYANAFNITMIFIGSSSMLFGLFQMINLIKRKSKINFQGLREIILNVKDGNQVRVK